MRALAINNSNSLDTNVTSHWGGVSRLKCSMEASENIKLIYEGDFQIAQIGWRC